ncbi:MAG: ferritin-like domain-containing protein, partial [Armatimonadota bacterium]|nr:ferritin-like domain-containing protein [Armatimonadota bacterium]
MIDFDKIVHDPVSRRAFLARMSAAGLGVAATALLAPAAEASGKPILEIVNVPDNANFPGIPGRNPTERVLNYALTLETLEADLYRQALNVAAGKPVETPLADDVSGYTMAVPTGNVLTTLAPIGFLYLQQFAAVEAAHRDFLRAAITQMGGTPVGPNPNGYKADFGNDLGSILTVIRTVEETGVRAYLGAAQFIDDFKVTQTAASIYST